jgi:hypothetical protein
MTLEHVERRIYFIRDQKVMIDTDLAELYGVPTFRLNEQVKRNRKRFPEDFMFQLTPDEYRFLTSQIAILKRSGTGKHRKYLPYAFTEQGVAMLSSVLHSERAIGVNIAVMRAFVRLREVLSTHKELVHKLEYIERRLESHDLQFEEHALEIRSVFKAIRRLMRRPRKSNVKIGYLA